MIFIAQDKENHCLLPDSIEVEPRLPRVNLAYIRIVSIKENEAFCNAKIKKGKAENLIISFSTFPIKFTDLYEHCFK